MKERLGEEDRKKTRNDRLPEDKNSKTVVINKGQREREGREAVG